jgi:DNA-binding NtrC family response regulator
LSCSGFFGANFFTAWRMLDQPATAPKYASQNSHESGRSVTMYTVQVTPAAIRTYSWPGNVRELINRVRRAVLLCEGRLIAISDLELPETSPAPVDQLDDARHSAERTAIAQAIQRASGNISRAAKLLGVSRVTLYRLMKKHKLQA